MHVLTIVKGIDQGIRIFSLIGLVVHLITDLTYSWVDPRIDFESREA